MKRFAASIFLKNGEAWTTKNFTPFTYLGEPSNIIRILNELGCDEIIVSSISGNSDELRLLTSQSFTPITYSGGINSIESALAFIRLGFDKVGLSSAALSDEGLLRGVAQIVGQANTVLIVSVIRLGSSWVIWDWKAKRSLQVPLESWLEKLPTSFFSELFVRSVDRDGTRSGPDLELIEFLRLRYTGNLIYGGGISSESDVSHAWARGADCVASSTFLSTFGKFSAPLVGYPTLKRVGTDANDM